MRTKKEFSNAVKSILRDETDLTEIEIRRVLSKIQDYLTAQHSKSTQMWRDKNPEKALKLQKDAYKKLRNDAKKWNRRKEEINKWQRDKNKDNHCVANRYQKWTIEEDQFLLHSTLTHFENGKILGRSMWACKKHRQILEKT